MKFFKTIFRNKKSRAWVITSSFLLVFLLVAGVLVNFYSALLDVVLGSDRAIEVPSEEAQVYYERTTASKNEANERGFALTKKVSEEGTILLKNNGALPLSSTQKKVSVFGKNSVDLVYGGTGSGGGDLTFTKKNIFDSLTAAGYSYNPTLKSFYEDSAKSGKGRDSSPTLSTGSAAQLPMSTGETPIENYTQNNIPASYAEYDDAAIIVLSRFAGESYDLPKMKSVERDQEHCLTLDKYERALIEHVSENFDEVIVVLNTLNIIEAGELQDNDKVDSILWIGGPGSTGIMALGEILNGSVTPSGRTVDIWARDFKKDPTWNNFSEAVDENGKYIDNSAKYTGSSELSDETFVKYQEDIYMGYRYYETKAYEERLKDENSTWYEENVVYPFGYGLSYTSFDWEVTEKSSIENVSITADGKYSVSVKVTNTGEYKGKDVVELYAKLHYNRNGLEKSHVVLCGFAKTEMLYPTANNAAYASDATSGEEKPNSTVVTLTFNPYDIASYDCYGLSGDKGWVIEEGSDYELFINASSDTQNEKKIAIPFQVDEKIVYANDPVTGNAVTNQYTDQTDSLFNSDYQVGTLMSRTSFILPSAPTATDRAASTQMVAALKDKTHNNPEVDSYTQKPTQGLAPTAKFIDLVRYDEDTNTYVADYDEDDTNDTWKAILDSLTVSEMSKLINEGGFKTNRIEGINKPETLESDGPVGWCNFLATVDTWNNNVAYTSQVVVSSTWNVELAREMGECVGEEALWGASTTDGRTYSGWYAPGVNLHRSPFCGRNFEYYSEDPFLSGKMAASLIQGCRSKGVYTYVKHFAVNEQETNRSGVATWLTEQALRELYLKSFEIAVKEGGTTTIMSSFNRIGTRWTGGDYRLLTQILRNEWGFRGTVICDYNTGAPFMNVKQMVYAGGDLNLATDDNSKWTPDKNSAADVTVVRKAVKNVFYTVANSNAINNLHYRYETAIWRLVYYAVNIVIVAVLIVWGLVAIPGAFKEKKTNSMSKRKLKK